MWKDLNSYWREAFSMAWEAYKRGTIPIGAVIVDHEGNIISRGRNRIFDEDSSNPLAGTYIAHAEMTAMLVLKAKDHPDIKSYTLYTTMEPCPMCFGTMVMMGIRNIKYAARDGIAGAVELSEKMDYIKSKNMNIKLEGSEPEFFQICLQSAYECVRRHSRMEELLNIFRAYCSDGVALGEKLYEQGYFKAAAEQGKLIEEVYDEVICQYNKED
jgi:tRNA(adenine34) deaminase